MTGDGASRRTSRNGRPDLLASYWTLAGPVEVHAGREWSLFDVAARVSAAAGAGFRGIGLWHADLLHILDGRSLAALRTVFDDFGIAHIELEFLTDWFADPGTDERMRSDRLRRTLLDAAGELGARHVKVGNFTGRDVPLALLTDRFGELCAEAAEHGTRVVYEFMKRDVAVRSMEAAVSLVKGAGAAGGGLGIDLCHVADLGTDVESVRAVPGALIGAVEINDGPRTPDGERRRLRDRTLPGEGELDVAGFVAAVRATGYDGPWGVELLSAAIGDFGPGELATRAYRAAAGYVTGEEDR